MWVTAIVLGLAGSLHCIVMCSPLAMAASNIRSNFFTSRLLYNAGRILTYAMLGAMVASIGHLINLTSLQSVLSVALGSLLVAMGILNLTSLRFPWISSAVLQLTFRLKKLFGYFLSQKSRLSLFMLGMVNGLLPCGLTYLALAYCLTLKGPLDGFNFMLLVGIGTLPAMLGFTGIIQILVKRFQIKASRLTMVVMIFVGILLIGRVAFTGIHTVHSSATPDVSNVSICK